MKRVFGGGVCIYVGEFFKVFTEKIKKYSTITQDYEILTLTISKPNYRKILIMCVYKPPTGKIENCIKFIKEIIQDPLFSKREIWILGDFNVDILKRNDPKSIQLQEFVKKAGLSQKINTITRPNRGGGSCIDLIITNCPFVESSGVTDDFVSDHYTVFSIRKKGRENNDCVFKTVRDYKRYDQDTFENLLSSKNWNIFRDYDDPNLQWDFIYRNVLDILSIMCPYKVISARKIPTPWITPEIYNMIKERRALTKTYKVTRDSNDLQLLRVHRNKLNSAIDKAKATYIVQSLHRTCKNPKKFWRIIK